MERRNKNTKSKGNGEGTIYFSETLQKWVAQYVEPSGNRKTLTQRKNEKVGDFKKRFNKIINDINENVYVEKTNISLYDLCKEIVEDKKNSNNICPNTYKRATYTLSYINNSNISNMSIQKITPKMIKDYLQTTTKYAQTTIDKIYQLLGQAFRRAIDRKYIVFNPMLTEEVKKPKSDKVTKKVEALTVEEENKLINVLTTSEKDHEYRNIILLMLFTGMRIGEVLALKYDNIQSSINSNCFFIDDSLTRDDEDNTILRENPKTKTKKSMRWIDVTPEVKTILQNCLNNYAINPLNLLFYDYQDNRIITPGEVNSYLGRINKKYKIAKHIHNHMLRHTFATRLIEAGVDIDVIQNKLGHKKIETTINTYCDLLELRKERQNDKISQYYEDNNIKLVL